MFYLKANVFSYLQIRLLKLCTECAIMHYKSINVQLIFF